MKTLKDKQEILIRYINKGESIRKISKEMLINRKTVSKYIERYSKIQEALKSVNSSKIEEYVADFVKAPTYDSSKRVRPKVTSTVIDKVKEYLESNRQKRSLGQRKQQMKKIDIYESLKESDFDIGYTTICNLIVELENEGKEAFVKQRYDLGDVCEFDWGVVKIHINGVLETYQLAVFTSAAGNYRYGRLYKKQDTLSFQESHAYFFEKINGSYKTMVYDNMRVAVKKFVGYHEKEATDGLLKLSSYYHFDFRFCNVRKGNEKGHVERSVEYLRRKAFSKKEIFDDLESANKYLNDICDSLNKKAQIGNDNKSGIEILELEKPYLLPQRPFFDCAELKSVRVDKYSTISLDTCRYSIPEKYVGKIIIAKVYPQKIIFSFESNNICTHIRLFSLHKWSINIHHYTKTLKRKPGALRNSLAIEQLGVKLQNIYKNHYLENPKDFLDLIEYMDKSSISIDKILEVILKLQLINAHDITTDKIKIICEKKEIKDTVKQAELVNSEIMDNCKLQLAEISSLFENSDSLNNEVEVTA